MIAAGPNSIFYVGGHDYIYISYIYWAHQGSPFLWTLTHPRPFRAKHVPADRWNSDYFATELCAPRGKAHGFAAHERGVACCGPSPVGGLAQEHHLEVWKYREFHPFHPMCFFLGDRWGQQGPVVWILGIPLWKGTVTYLGAPRKKSQNHRDPDHQSTIC